MVDIANGAVQSQIGMFAAIIVTKFKACPQYLLPEVSPQLPPEPIEYKVENISKGSLDTIQSPSVKIQILSGH